MDNPLIFIVAILLLISFAITIWGMIKNSAVIIGGALIATNIVLLTLLVARFLR